VATAHIGIALAEPRLEGARDDATALASRDMERAGIDLDNPATVPRRSGGAIQVPRITDPIRRLRPVERRDVEFLRANTDRKIKITLPDPFAMSRQAKNEFYKDEKEIW
jgi:5-methyltetrahydropteroyltriglutamate--homocysteine methyltransferase